MEDRKRTIFAVVIACVVLIAVLYSFGLNLFTSKPQLVLADPDATASQGTGEGESGNQGGLPVEVTPETVQRVVAYLSRYESYSRTVTITYYWGEGGVGSVSAQIWANNGWSRTDTTLASGMVEHSIVWEDELWLWYDDDETVYHGTAGDMTADLMQRLPTYETVLALDANDITDAGYMEKGGQACIYVETRQNELGYLYRYWISISSGLLMSAETECDGKIIYEMSSREVVSPLTNANTYFVLPDGTNLFSSLQDPAGA